MRPPLLLAFCCVLAAAAAAQNIKWLPDKNPSGRGNAFPWGSAGLRYQVIAPGSLLGSKPALIQDLFVAGEARRGARQIFYEDIEIRMGMTPRSTATNSWTANNPKPVTLYRGPLRVLFEPGKWRGVGLPAAFPYRPTPGASHVCIEIIAWKIAGQPIGRNFYSPPSGGVRRAFRWKWTQNRAQGPLSGSGAGKLGILLDDGNFVAVGAGCKSSAGTRLAISAAPGTRPQLGKTFRVDLTGGAPNTPAFLGIGGDTARWQSLRLPFDLGAAGAPGCSVWHDVRLTFGTAVRAGGGASFPLPIPAGAALWGARAYASWINFDPKANTLGITTSSYAVLIVGT